MPIEGGKRAIPIPGRPVHMSVLAKTFRADKDGDADCIETARDKLLEFLATPLLSYWTLIYVWHACAVVLTGAVFFFMLVGWHGLCDPPTGCEPRNTIYNVTVQLLTALFTFAVLLTWTWRAANVHQLLCSKRGCEPGFDFYGRPTEVMSQLISAFVRAALNRSPPLVSAGHLVSLAQVASRVDLLLRARQHLPADRRPGGAPHLL